MRRKSYAGCAFAAKVGPFVERSCSNNNLDEKSTMHQRRHSQNGNESDETFSFSLKGDPTADAKVVSAWVALGYGKSDTEYYEVYADKMLKSNKWNTQRSIVNCFDINL